LQRAECVTRNHGFCKSPETGIDAVDGVAAPGVPVDNVARGIDVMSGSPGERDQSASVGNGDKLIERQ
jgi:hypothetical protein